MRCTECGEQGWNLRPPDEWAEHNWTIHDGQAKPALVLVVNEEGQP